MVIAPHFPYLSTQTPACDDRRIAVRKGIAFAYTGILSRRMMGMAPLKTESLHRVLRATPTFAAGCGKPSYPHIQPNRQRTTGFKGCVVLFPIGDSVARPDGLTHTVRLQLAVRLFVHQRHKIHEPSCSSPRFICIPVHHRTEQIH